MGIIYWQEEAQAFQIAKSMQAIAVYQDLWDAYMTFGSKGREVFRQCAQEDYDWSLNTVLAYAAYEDNPPPQVSATPQVSAPPRPSVGAPSGVRIPERGEAEDTKADSFIKWMKAVTAGVKQDSSLAYGYGDRRLLKDGTVAVSVAVRRGSKFLRRVSFVFHYHPGAKGAQVGSTEGSKWHFKPFDGAKKWVRLADYDFGHLDPTMVRTVKDIARNRK